MRRCLALFGAFLLLSALSGCGLGRGIYSNYRAVEDLQLVQTLGVDAGYVLSAATGRPREGKPTVLRRAAASIPQGMDALQQRTPRGQLYFAHTRYIVLGEDYAAAGVGPVLDFVERDTLTRMGALLFVVRGGTAEALVTGAGEDWDVGDVLATVRQETEAHGDSHVFDVRETAVSLSEYGAALVCALRLTDTGGSVFGLAPGLAAVPDGYGILRDGALVGFLDGGQARAASLMRGVLGVVTQELRLGDGRVTVELRCAMPEVCFDGRVLSIRAEPTAVLVGADTAASVMDPSALAALTAAIDRSLTDDLTRLLARVQAEGCDFLSLGRALRRQGIDPAELPADWLTSCEYRVTVETVLRHSYDLGERAGTDGGGTA